MMPPAMSNTPAMRTGVQLSLKQQDAEQEREDRLQSHHDEIRDSQLFSLHRQRLQGRPGHEQREDNQGRRKLGEAFRQLHENAAHREEQLTDPANSKFSY